MKPETAASAERYRADGARADRQDAVRGVLAEIAANFPGQAVELRVPPDGAIQCLGGTVHRRGTPPATVEMSPDTLLALATGQADWDTAVAQGLVAASGERSNLSQCFPLG